MSRLVGAPPGYIGHDDGGQLTEAVRRRPYSVVLLDEAEKAHRDVFDTFLQVLDDGRLTDSKGRTVDFSHCYVILTGNVPPDRVRDAFRPEFLNRLDRVLRFEQLSGSALEEIAATALLNLAALVAEEHQVSMALGPGAAAAVARAVADEVATSTRPRGTTVRRRRRSSSRRASSAAGTARGRSGATWSRSSRRISRN